MPRVVHFEVPADNPERASKFYQTVFGWTFEKWNGPQDYWLIETGPKSQPGINGGMYKRQGPGGTANTVDVPSVEEYITKITKAGGKILMGKTTVPGIGYFAACQDTEGNAFSVMKFDEQAK